MTDPSPSICTHLGYFGIAADRYNPAGYQKGASTLQRIRSVSTVEGLKAVELNYPSLVTEETVEEVKSVLTETGLGISNVSLNVWGASKWKFGSLCSPDPAIRTEAIATMQRGVAVARSIGSSLVSFWPAQEGFDYPFEVNYATAVDRFVWGMKQVAAFDPQMRICLEYKPKEPRAHLLADTVGRVMWLIGKIGAPNVGVLLDIGHAWLAYENVAQSAVLLQHEGLLDLLHFNDNDGAWDWDMIPGTVRFWELVELMFWLREIGYAKWYSIDIEVARGDPVQACAHSVKNIQRLYRLAGKLNREEILSNLQRAGHPENLRLVADTVFGVLGV